MRERVIRTITVPLETIIRVAKTAKENPATIFIYASISGVTTGITAVVWGEFPVSVGIGSGIASSITGAIMLTFANRLMKKPTLK